MTMTEMIAEYMWEKIEPMIRKNNEEKEKKEKKSGRPKADEKKAFTGIIHILRTASVIV